MFCLTKLLTNPGSLGQIETEVAVPCPAWRTEGASIPKLRGGQDIEKLTVS
jgi:hypothetical protein